MKFYTHIAGGVLLFTLLVWLFNLPFSFAGIFFVGFVSVLPDLIDRVIGEHRGWGHSVIWLIPIFTAFLFNYTLGMAFLSGFMMHILFDVITRKGVPFFYPFSATRLVMPKTEKSRIITGSKQEKALFIVVLLLLLPLAFAVVYGVDLGSALGGNSTNATLNKTNKTKNPVLGNITKYVTGDLRSKNSYPKYTTGSGNSKKSTSAASSKTNQSTTNNDDQGLLDWLKNNPPTVDNTNETNETVNNTASNTIFNDMNPNSFDNLQEGQYIETAFNASSDNSTFDFLEGFGDWAAGGDNPDDEYDSGMGDDTDYSDGLAYLLAPIFSLLGGVAYFKP